MSTSHCPDCLAAVAVRSRRQDARCDDCRAQVGQRRQRQGRGVRMALIRDLGPGEWRDV